MISKILHLYGPLYINSYGLCIALALGLLVYCLRNDAIFKKHITYPQLIDLVVLEAVIGICGARFLFVLESFSDFDVWWQIFLPWHGGYAILGGVISVLATVPFALKKYNAPIFPTLDRVALYAPLAQSVSRIGCFLAGCCYGTACSNWWALTYSDIYSLAPLYTPVHPTQLYSVGMLFFIFLFQYYFAQRRLTRPGQMLILYIVLCGFERFFVDFFRADRTLMSVGLSYMQYVALGLVMVGGIILLCTYKKYESV